MYELLLQASDWWLGTAVGGGLVLLVGCVLMLSARNPATRQRLGEVAVFAALLVAGLRLLPSWLPGCLPPLDFAGSAVASPSKMAPPRLESPDVWKALPVEDENAYVVLNGPTIRPNEAASEMVSLQTWTWRDVTAATAAAYLLVAAVLACRWLLGHWALGRLLRQARPAGPRIRRLFTTMAVGAVWPFPCLRLSRRLRAPVCFGLRRPAVLLPEPMEHAADAELRWVFAHELTHLRRRDPWSSWALGLAQVVYFYLPWYWWLRRQVRLCQEYIADAAAAGAGPAADEYAEFLVSLARGTALPLGASGLGSSSDLLRRVQMLLQSTTRVRESWTKGRSLLAAGGLLCVAVLAGGVGLRAESPREDNKTDEKKEVVLVRPTPSDGDVLILRTDGDDKDGPQKHRVTLRLLGDDDEKGEKKADGKDKAKVQKKMMIVVDDGSGPITIPFDGDTSNIDKKVQEAIAKARAKKKADGGDQNKAEAIGKALEALKGELSDEQMARLKRHLQELKAQQGAVEKQRGAAEREQAAAERAHAAAERAHAAAQRAAEKMAEHAEQLKAHGIDAEQLHKQIEEAMKQAHMAGKDGEMKLRTGPNTFTFAGGGGRLGVMIKKPSSDLADQLDLPKERGIVVTEIVKGSPAAKAGLKANDILLEVDGKAVRSEPEAFIKQVHDIDADKEIVIVVLRKGHKEKVSGIKLPEAKKGGNFLWKQLDGEDGAKGEHRLIEVHPKIEFTPEGGKVVRVAPVIKRFGPDDEPAKAKDGAKVERRRIEVKGDEDGEPGKFRWRVFDGKDGKDEKKVSRNVSVSINNGKLVAEQKEDDLTITVTGTVEDKKVNVESIVIADGYDKKSYKRVSEVPEKHRDSVKRLISNTSNAPVQFQFKREKSDE
jgi:beta-lactamase regulating signal transducer with metallopeptidase domain